MTRCTAEAAVALRMPHYEFGTVERLERDDWMCRALAQPRPTPVTPTTSFLELHDALVNVRYPDAANYTTTRTWVALVRRTVEKWFNTTVAGQARVELSPEDLWALFQLVDMVGNVVDWAEGGFSSKLPDQDTDVCWADFDEPADQRVVS